jgi:putative addiction module component (TIGR02574 family)
MTKIARLSPEERLTLISQLWDSLDEHQVPLTPAQQAELEHCLATLEHDRGQSIPCVLDRGRRVARGCPFP